MNRKTADTMVRGDQFENTVNRVNGSPPLTAAAGADRTNGMNTTPKVRQRVRIRFGKRGDLRLIGHRDLARLMERLFRRAGLRLGMSEGFHPKPRMTFPSALAVGIEGLDEIMELELADVYTAEELLARLARQRVPGLMFHSVDVLPPGSKKARLRSLTYEIPLPVERRAETADRVDRLMASRSFPIQRPNRPEPLDLRHSLEAVALEGDTLSMRFRVLSQASAGPRDALAALGLEDLESRGMHLARKAVEVEA